MISFVLIILAAICNSIMDVITHHWSESIFDKPKGIITKWEIWWNPDYSWINKYIAKDVKKGLRKIWIFDVPFTDAWHTFKSIMIILFALAIVFYKQVFNWYTDFIIIGIIWNSIFNLFYNKILLK